MGYRKKKSTNGCYTRINYRTEDCKNEKSRNFVNLNLKNKKYEENNEKQQKSNNHASDHSELEYAINNNIKDLNSQQFGNFNTPKGFKRIRNLISLDFFNKLKYSTILTSDMISSLEFNILNRINFSNKFTRSDLSKLQNLLNNNPIAFRSYFSDLVDIIKCLISWSRTYKEIDAIINLNDVIRYLYNKGINLSTTIRQVGHVINQIFKFLQLNHPDFFPLHTFQSKGASQKDHEKAAKIRRAKLKIYIIKNIYKGKYCKDGRIGCLECFEEDYSVNGDITRLNSLEFHHHDEKQNLYTAQKIYDLFSRNKDNPEVLEEIISLMESENVFLSCRNHHLVKHSPIYQNFKYLINYKTIFSYLPEVINMLINVSVNSFLKTHKLDKNKEDIKNHIKSLLKKRYIIEHVFGLKCHICDEFSVEDFLPIFEFHHFKKEKKTIRPIKLFRSKITCSEILKKLIDEEGTFICGNCHASLTYNTKNRYECDFLENIFENNDYLLKAMDDIIRINEKITLIHFVESIKNPLKKKYMIRDNFLRYMLAINEISQLGHIATPNRLSDYLDLPKSSILQFFRNKVGFVEKFVNISDGIKGNLGNTIEYTLTDLGEGTVEIIIIFRDYYSK